MRRPRRPLVIAALGLGLLASAAGTGRAEGPVAFRGYFKSFSIFLAPPAAKWGDTRIGQPALGAVNNRLRLKLALRPGDTVAFDVEYDLSPRIQDRRLFGDGLLAPGTGLGGYRLADLRSRLYPDPDKTPESFAVFQNLDRLMVTVKTGFADVIVGRQPIAWGSARVVNPTDVLAPFAFNELDKEERTGVDAVRLRIPLGPLDELDLGAVAGDRFKARTSAFYVRGRVNVLRTDLSALALAFRDHLLVGLDLARSIGGAGAWLEAAYVVPEAFRKAGTAGERNYVRASAGLDYNFGPKTYGFAEYHFDSAGRGQAEDYLSLAGTVPYRDGAVYLLGRHYLSAGATWQAGPLLPVTGLLIANLTDASLIFAPSAEYNVSENIYLAGGAYVGVGRRPEIVGSVPAPGVPPNLLHSEFGSYPDMLFISFRVYF